jgi:rhodanese-related sulfurtransferase
VATVSWSHWPTGEANATFVDEVRAVTPQGPAVFICRSGARSAAAARVATEAGIVPAYNVAEGFEGDLDEDGHRGGTGWRARGLPWRQS